MSNKGKRYSFWVGQEDSWIIEMLEKRITAVEMAGEMSSFGEELRKILRKELKKDWDYEYGTEGDN